MPSPTSGEMPTRQELGNGFKQASDGLSAAQHWQEFIRTATAKVTRQGPQQEAPELAHVSADEVSALTIKMGKEGLTPSQIGVRLRDDYGIPLVKPMIGKSIADCSGRTSSRRSTPSARSCPR